jgi:sulfite reductase (ferredoxin)
MSTPEQDASVTPDNNLLGLGIGNGSKVERIKVTSNYLHGQIQEELEQDTSRFSEDQVQLIKFHGMYQQEDRDVRQARKAASAEKAYQFMIRSRIPGGALTAEQYLVEDEIADRFANGTLRITTRQGFQLHGILKGNIRATIRQINDALLSTLAACGDVNRNVMACPAPSANRAQAQIQEIAHKIAMHLAPRSKAYHELWLDGEKVHTVGEDSEAAGGPSPETAQTDEVVEPIYGPTYLPRKFKIGIAFPGDNCVDVYTQDIGLIARMDGETLVGFTVAIGGGMGSTHGKAETHPLLAKPLADVSVEQVLPVVETIVTVQRDYGDRQNRKHARMKYVIEDRGIDWFRTQVEQRLGFTLSDPSPVVFHDVEDHLGWHEQADGRWFLGLHVENGRIKDNETIRMKSGLRDVVTQFRPGIRLTGQQNILLTDIPADQRVLLEESLHTYGIITDPQAIGAYRFAMACPALPTCGLALAEAERVLPSIVQQIEAELHESLQYPPTDRGNEENPTSPSASPRVSDSNGTTPNMSRGTIPLSIRMTGCPNGCARPFMGDIGLVGRSKDLYNIYIGGDWSNTRLNTLYAPSVRTEQILATLRPLLILWRNERQSLETFGDFCHRIGVEELRTRFLAKPAGKA